MSRKLHPLAAAIRVIDVLSDDEKLVLRDYLRPAPKPRSKPKPERKPSQKQKAGKEATAAMPSPDTVCANCQRSFSNNVHHLPSHPGYHEFVEPAGEAKGAGG